MKRLFVFLMFCLFQMINAQNTPETLIKSDSAKYYFELERKEINLEKRIKFIDKAIEIERENFFLHNEKASIYIENKEYQKYEQYLKKMMTLFPSKGEVDAQIGFYEEGLGNRKQADKYFESSIKKINTGLKTEKNYQNIASLNFSKMISLLFLNKKKEVQEIIDNTKEEDAQQFLSNYFQGMKDMSRDKLYQFIKTDLK